MSRARIAAAVLVLSLSASPEVARAGDGIAEINQACAVGPGCFPGDAPGFPVTIGEPGAYQLTSGLTVPDENTTAILVESDRVSIDLRGFAIRGVTVCGGFPTSCAPTGSGVGIQSFPSTMVRVRNGSVSGMGSTGVNLGADGVVEDLTVVSNGSNGISVTLGVMRNNLVRQNGFRGVSGSGNVVGNSIEQSGFTGLRITRGLVLDNLIRQNGGDGIEAVLKVSVRGNQIEDNGDSSADDGVECGDLCNVVDNVIIGSAGVGIRGPTSSLDRSVYRGNRLDNDSGNVTGLMVDLGQNYCTDGSTILTCP